MKMDIDQLLQRRLDKACSSEEYEFLVNNAGNLTDAQLVSILRNGEADHLREVAREEMIVRGVSIPHWSTTWNFWLTLIAAVAAILSVCLQIASM